MAATFTSDAEVLADWIRSVYESRCLVELDIRAVKCSLKMNEAALPSVSSNFVAAIPHYGLINIP